MATYLSIVTLVQVLSWLFPTRVIAGSMASWNNGLGAPQIIMQDDATGKIFYSLCNSNEQPIFPANDSAAFPIDEELHPKPGTGLGGTGYQEGENTIAAIQWLTDQNQIVHSLYKCNSTTGMYEPSGSPNSWIVSTSVKSIHPDTGLASAVLDQDAGIRVFYQSEQRLTSILKYLPVGGWSYGGNVSQDDIEGFPISTGFTDINKITVVAPRDDTNIEVSTLQSNGSWIISTFPTPLENVDRQEDRQRVDLPPTNYTKSSSFYLDSNTNVDWSLEGWDGKTNAIGLTLDSKATRSIFYIGTDSVLHHLTEDDGTWKIAANQAETIWPVADEPNSRLSATYDYSHNAAWIYYMSGGNMTQVHQSNGEWQPASTLLKFNDTQPSQTPSNGLSTGAQAGIGVGVSVAGIALLGLGFYIFRQRRRGQEEKKKAEAEAEAAAAANQAPSSFGSPAPAYVSGVVEGQWIDGQWVPTPNPAKPEGRWQDYSYQPVQNAPPVFEMPQNEFSHEMSNDTSYYEMPTTHNDTGASRK